jgi:hypothetical protein
MSGQRSAESNSNEPNSTYTENRLNIGGRGNVESGQQSGQVSPIDRTTSSNAEIQASGVVPGNGFRHACSRARFHASGSERVASVSVMLAFSDGLLLDQHA